MRDPDRVAMRGANPAAVNPDVTVAVPAVITVDPDPTFMRWMVMDFDDRLGGSHANYDLRESSGRNETDSKQQRQCSFFHRDFALHGKCPSTRIGEAFRAIILINTRLRIWLRALNNYSPGVKTQSLLFTVGTCESGQHALAIGCGSSRQGGPQWGDSRAEGRRRCRGAESARPRCAIYLQCARSRGPCGRRDR